MNYLLAIDQSTSSTKVVLFDQVGELVDKEARDHRQIYPQPGWVEHDAEEIWQNLTAAAKCLVSRNPAAVASLAGVSVANQRETFVIFERETAAPLHNAVVWQCRRGQAICEEMTYDGHGGEVRRATGLKLDTYFPAPKIKELLRAQPGLAERLRSGDALISTIDAYLVYRLTSGETFATDHTNASRTLLYDIRRLGWDDRLCELFNVPVQALPSIYDCNARFGRTDLNGALPSPVPICGVMGDSHASLFAARCYAPGEGKATFGTGTSIMMNIGATPAEQSENAVLALAWVLGGKPTYALEGLINYSSATIAWLRDQLGLISDAAQSEALAREADDNGGVYLVPAFAGLSAPYWNANARAAIVGMTGHTSKSHVVRAALEAISYQIRDVLTMINDEARISPGTMSADGGPTRNEFLMQFTADVTQLHWQAAETAESSALGAAMAGMLGLGIHASMQDLERLPRKIQPYQPRMDAAQADELYRQWQSAVQRVL